MAEHAPSYVYCGSPEWCCGHWHPVAVECRVDAQNWPCDTKRSHRTAGQIARIERWVKGRTGRPPILINNGRADA